MAINFCTNALAALLHENKNERGEYVFDENMTTSPIGGATLFDVLYLGKLLSETMGRKLKSVVVSSAYVLTPQAVYKDFPRIYPGKEAEERLIQLFSPGQAPLILAELTQKKLEKINNYKAVFDVLPNIKGFFAGLAQKDGQIVDFDLPEAFWHDLIYKNNDSTLFPWQSTRACALQVLYNNIDDWKQALTFEEFEKCVVEAQDKFNNLPIRLLTQAYEATHPIEKL